MIPSEEAAKSVEAFALKQQENERIRAEFEAKALLEYPRNRHERRKAQAITRKKAKRT